MLAALARLFTPSSDRAAPPMRMRRYEGAAGGRRWGNTSLMSIGARSALAAVGGCGSGRGTPLRMCRSGRA